MQLKKTNKPRYIDIMPQLEDYEAFKKYLLDVRRELDISIRYNIKNNTLKIGDTSIYFNSYINAMCYLEGYKKGREYENQS